MSTKIWDKKTLGPIDYKRLTENWDTLPDAPNYDDVLRGMWMIQRALSNAMNECREIKWNVEIGKDGIAATFHFVPRA